MKLCNKLVRNGVVDSLKASGYRTKSEQIRGDEYKVKLYCLFLQEYKETLQTDKEPHLYAHYADMLEVIKTLMIYNKVNINALNINQTGPMEWYKSFIPQWQKLADARMDLLQKFEELQSMKTEAIRDQLVDMFNSFKQLVEAHKLSFAQVNKVSMNRFKQLGGFNKGLYLVGVSETKESNQTI